jgi:hypothetical protein
MNKIPKQSLTLTVKEFDFDIYNPVYYTIKTEQQSGSIEEDIENGKKTIKFSNQCFFLSLLYDFPHLSIHKLREMSGWKGKHNEQFQFEGNMDEVERLMKALDISIQMWVVKIVDRNISPAELRNERTCLVDDKGNVSFWIPEFDKLYFTRHAKYGTSKHVVNIAFFYGHFERALTITEMGTNVVIENLENTNISSDVSNILSDFVKSEPVDPSVEWVREYQDINKKLASSMDDDISDIALIERRFELRESLLSINHQVVLDEVKKQQELEKRIAELDKLINEAGNDEDFMKWSIMRVELESV